jgi:ElaB/YqjD/DUF883 family membrane-anchored ribosome-binding protein
MATGTYNPKAREDEKQKDDPNKNKGDAQNRDQGHNQDITEKVKDVGAQIMDKAKDAAVSVGDMASQACATVAKKADDYAATAGADIKKFGDNMSEKSPHEGLIGHASQAMAETIKGGGHYLEEAKLSGMADDVTHLVQRHPMPALLICLGVGFMLGRAMRD